MKYIFDISIIAVILIAALIGRKSGFIRSFLSLIKGAAAFWIAGILGKLAGAFVFENSVRKTLINKFTEALTQTADVDPNNSLWNSIPKFLQNALVNSGISEENFSSEIASSGKSMAIAAADAVEGVIVSLLSMLFTLISFFILLFLFSLLIKVLNGMFKLPVLNTVNKLFGCVFGALLGTLIVFIICRYFTFFVSLFGQSTASAIIKASESSYLYVFFSNLF